MPRRKIQGDSSCSSRGQGVKSRRLQVIEHHMAKTERRHGAPRDHKGKHHSKKHESGCGLHANHITHMHILSSVYHEEILNIELWETWLIIGTVIIAKNIYRHI